MHEKEKQTNKTGLTNFVTNIILLPQYTLQLGFGIPYTSDTTSGQNGRYIHTYIFKKWSFGEF